MTKVSIRPRSVLREWLALAGAFIVLGSFIGWSQYNDYIAVNTVARDRLSTQARVVHDTIGRQLHGANLALESIKRDLPKWRARKDGMQDANEQLRVFSDAMSGVRVMLILDVDGNTIAANRPELLGRNFRARDYYQSVAKNPNPDTLYVTPPFKTVLNTWVINVVRMVPGPNGEFNGLISASLDPDEFNNILDSVRFAPDMVTSLVHSSGKLFLRSPPQPALSGADLNKPGSLFSHHMANGQMESVQEGIVALNDEHRLMVQRTTHYPALKMDTPLVIAVSRNVQALYAPWRQDSLTQAAMFTLLAVISALSLFYLHRHRRSSDAQAREADLKLRESRERLLIATDAAEMGIWDWDIPNNQLIWDDWMYRIYGVTADCFGGAYETWQHGLHPDDLARASEDVARCLRDDTPFESSFRIVRPDGEVRYIKALARNEKDDEGTIVRMVGVNYDITDNVLNEMALVQSKQTAEAASRAKSLFLANMSHEIRTPMNAVLGLLQLLQHTELTERQLDYAQKAHAAGTSLLGILNDILDFSKVEAGKMQIEHAAFHFDDVLRNLSVMLSSSVGKKDVEVLFDMDADLPRGLYGDSLRLQQVLLNLCGNAIKFTEHGEVVLHLRTLERTPKLARIEFSIRDTGIGIAADMLDHIFEGFTQAESSTTRRFGGTGLGLAISQRMVHLMGGTLTADSTLGKGSCFRFTLEFQRAADDTHAAPRTHFKLAEPTAARHDATTPLHVLIVDDNAVAREVLGHITGQIGWNTELVSSGNEALARLQSADAPFDAIFVDWKMPDLDGWETTLKIRELFKGKQAPAVIMVTAHGPEIMAEHKADEGLPFDGFLVKPITPSMMFDAVANATVGTSVTIDRRTERRQSTQRLEGMHLLLVEDNPMNQQVARELLTHQGATVVVANNGRQGIERVAQALAAHALFDVVLMDIQMPEMDGYEATRLLREELRLTSLPIIAMTANAMPADRVACLAAGMNDHVGKPFDLNELIETLLRHTGHEAHAVSKPGAPATIAMPANSDTPAGFELDLALRRLENNKKLYALLARSFRAEQGADAILVRQALAQGDRDTALRLMHTLKGVAATLGASALSALAKETEVALKTESTPEASLTSLFDRLDAELKHSCVELEQIAVRFSQE